MLREVFDTFRSMNKSMNSKLHLFKQYNIEALVAPQLSQTRSVLSQLFNAFVKALNDFKYLPKYILIMLDKDIIDNIGVYDFGIADTIKDCIKWLLININHYLELHTEDMTGKRPGPIFSTSEPWLIWITMLCRPVDSFAKNVFSLVCKFNNILETVISGDKRSHILKVHIDTHTGNFDRIGNLTNNGQHDFCWCIDNEMNDFDFGNTELQPFAGKNPPTRMPTQMSNNGYPDSQRDAWFTHKGTKYSGRGNHQNYPPKNSHRAARVWR